MKMKCLFKNMRAINKLDHWTKLQQNFRDQSEHDKWYPVPKLENPEAVLEEITNPEVPPGNIQIIIEPNDVCLGKDLSMKFSFKGREDALPSLLFKIDKN